MTRDGAFADTGDKDLVNGLDQQAIDLFLFRLADHLAGLLSGRAFPLPYGTTIVRLQG